MSTVPIVNLVSSFIKTNQLIERKDKIVIGLSGGADSVALVYLLNEMQSVFDFELFLCHLNHKIRGKEADDDQQYCIALAKTLKLPIYTESQDILEISKQTKESLELSARNIRYDFFKRACEEFSANKIALAHHQDDQCETIIFNLARGTGIHGLRGMPLRRILYKSDEKTNVEIIRPILCCTKSQLENFLQAKNVRWQIDKTNYQLKASRNIIRHKILPAMEQLNPAVKRHLLDLAEQAADMEKIIDEQAAKIFEQCSFDSQKKDKITIEMKLIRKLPELVACEVVRKMILAIGAGLRNFTANHFKNIVQIEKSCDLPEGLRAIKQDDKLTIIRKANIKRKSEIRKNEISCELKITKKKFDREEFGMFRKTKTKYQEMIDADKIVGELNVRFALQGERFHPLGSPGHKKIGDFLTDVKAGVSARPALVVADEQSVVWLVGWRIDERVKITDKTKNVLILEIIGRM